MYKPHFVRRSNLFKIAALQFVLVAAFTLLADLLLWLFAPIYLDDIVEVVQHQNQPGVKKTILFKEKHGLRAISVVHNPKPENLIRVLCLGASTTQQSTQQTEDTWCGILETELRTHYAKLPIIGFQTVAHGAGGDRALNSAIWLKNNFYRVEPDIVVTLLGINDLSWNGGPGYKQHDVPKVLFEGEEVHTLKEKCKRYSQICRRVTYVKRNIEIRNKIETGKAVEWHTANLPKLRKDYHLLRYVDDPQRNPDPINEFRDVISWLKDFLTQKNVPLILMGQPVLWKDSFTAEESNALWFPVNTPTGAVRASGAWLYREMQKYNLVQKGFANGSSVQYLDLDEKLPKSLQYYFDDCHYTDEGSRLISKVVLPVLINSVDKLLRESK